LPFDDIEKTNNEAMKEWRDSAIKAMGLTPVTPQR